MALVIGVTGGMGCGKSTVAKILSKELNALLLDADKISREAMKSKEILTNICTFFSNDIFDEAGNIDRKKIATLAFSDEAKLRKLNSIIHPYVMQQIRHQIIANLDNYDFIILDVPIPNKDFMTLSNKIITVWADIDVRINRILKRSTTLSTDEILARIKKQMPQEEYEALADFVIYNNDDLETLNLKISNLLNEQIFLEHKGIDL